MDSKTFWKQWKGINIPEYRGAPAPEFDPAKINETEFADELRIKELDSDFIPGENGNEDRVKLEWAAQSWNADGLNGLVDEIKRCFKYIGFIGKVELEIWERGCRGEDESAFITFKVD